MKYFFKNILTLVGAAFFSCFIFPFGIPWSIGHAIVMSFKIKWNRWFWLLVRFVDGTFYAFGYLLFCIAKFLDILWNVWAGEAFEDAITTRENTEFGTIITISEATGKEETEFPKRITKTGRFFSKCLNIMFGQEQHAKDAYELGGKRKELESKYYK